ncbi:MAG TPA: META domain-containing protein [Anaerolineales bacterium]|nr:META domain-containing protein [Anaerolineales bacterium]
MKPFVKRIVSLCMGSFILFLAACGSRSVAGSNPEEPVLPISAEITPSTGADLVNTQWALEAIVADGIESPSLSTTSPYLEFRDNEAARGSGGCNTFSTQYQAQDGRISFGPVAATKIACAVEILQQEQSLFDALASADRFEISGDTLQIWYAQGQSILTFSRTTISSP